MADSTFATLQHFAKALHPLYCELDGLHSRVQDAQHTNQTGNLQETKATKAKATSMPVEYELEMQSLPELCQEGAWFPCFENAHDWEALQIEVNDASRHFSLPAAKVAWKKWALCPGNVQVVVAVAWWVVAHVFQPGNPSSPRLQAHVLQVFSSCYAHSVLKSRKDSYVSLWLDVVSAAAVRLLREAFPHQQRKLNSDLHGLVQAQLVRWTSGLLPSDLHPSPDALAPSAAPAPPSTLPASPGITANASGAAQRAQQTPSPSSPKPSPPAGLQPAAVTLYQRHVHQEQQERMRQQEQEHADQAGAAAATDNGANRLPPLLSDAPSHHAHEGSPAAEDSITAVASGASPPPTCQWLSVEPGHHRQGSRGGSPMHPLKTRPYHPAGSAAAAAAEAAAAAAAPIATKAATAQPLSQTGLNYPAGTAVATVAAEAAAEAAAKAQPLSQTAPPAFALGSPARGSSAGSAGRLLDTHSAANTHRWEPTTAQRRRSQRRPARGLRPQQGMYHSHYQPRRRHQHSPAVEDGGLNLVAADALPGSLKVPDGVDLLTVDALPDRDLVQDQHETQQLVLQGWQDSDQGPSGVPEQLEPQLHQQLRQQQQQQQQQSQALATSTSEAPHSSSGAQPQDPPPLALSRHGFPMTQLSPVMTTLLQARAREDWGGSRQAPAPPLLSSGMRHETLGAILPALRPPLHSSNARSRGVALHGQEGGGADGLRQQQPQEHHSSQHVRSSAASAFQRRGEGSEEDPEAELRDGLSYAKKAAKESTQRAADAVARYEAHKKASKREVASIQREWRNNRGGLSNQQQSEAFNQMLADKLSGWVESWGDAGRIMKGKPQATTRVTHHQQQGPSSKGSASVFPKSATLPATATDAVIGSRGGASLGAAVGVRSTGVPFAGGSSAANPPGYTQMTEAAVAGVRQAGTSILAACAATARSAPPSTTRIMQPWSKMRALEARAQDALDPARHNAADVAAHVAAAEKRALVARSKASQQAWRPQSNTEHKRGTLDVRIRTQARKAMHSVDMGMYER
ncbi:hypothetical protein DUNSADRAFT_8487 [Dunaliella salina]|uniref:Uncharacterized protein n=1 Tax=Dunaliella salina TaxID=3046 RepID=A0ABQ7GJC7_DUNSA|nr:hypothetical protein DUNSADRAFT_8487 [Dunaliella salina]|eukprot:KAF5834717.1 hypothetical protein DUNSADRAFT_8487 [Dunaliella salina]